MNLQEFLSMIPEIPLSGSLTLCRHIVTGLQTVHAAGFTHGAINTANIWMYKDKSTEIPSLVPQLFNFDFSASAKDQPADLIYTKQGNEYDAPELKDADTPQQKPFSDLIKCDIFSLGILMIYVFGGGTINASGSIDSNPQFLATAVASITASAPNEWSRDFIAEELAPALSEMLERDPARRAENLDRIDAKLNELRYIMQLSAMLEDGLFEKPQHSRGSLAAAASSVKQAVKSVFRGANGPPASAEVIDNMPTRTRGYRRWFGRDREKGKGKAIEEAVKEAGVGEVHKEGDFVMLMDDLLPKPVPRGESKITFLS